MFGLEYEAMAAPANMSSLPPNVDRGSGILIDSWIEAVLGISMTLLRFYTRSKIIRIVGWDDWTMGFATVSNFYRQTSHGSDI